MKLFLTSAYETHPSLNRFRTLASLDTLGRHSVTHDAESADAILFVESAQFDDYLYRALRQHPLVAQFPEKVFMFNEVDKPWGVLPGLYCSMPRSFHQPRRQVSFPFLETPNKFIPDVHRWDVERRWLFSFVGAASHRVRRGVLALGSDEDGVRDTSDFNVWDSSEDERRAQGRVFAQTMAESHYMLCPRGIGTSSFRLFETLEAGRAPVIISDNWVEPPHVDWDFAIWVPERDVHLLPELLRSMRDEAEDRGRAARQAWEKAFAPHLLFDLAGESLAYLLEEQVSTASRSMRQKFRRLMVGGEMVTLDTARRLRNTVQQLGA